MGLARRTICLLFEERGHGEEGLRFKIVETAWAMIDLACMRIEYGQGYIHGSTCICLAVGF